MTIWTIWTNVLVTATASAVIAAAIGLSPDVARAEEPRIGIKQITFGPKHHFFGYIGHVGTIPWNKSGRTIVALETDFQDHLPKPDEAARIVLLDTADKYSMRVVDESRGWNLQQGTMLYWNPKSPETQFFFNDRDPKTGKVFCVLADVEGGGRAKRIREFRYEETPVGNSGVAQQGGRFAAINYARLARLRPVTGYAGATDWTVGEAHPADDGVFVVDAETKEKRLIASFAKLHEVIRNIRPDTGDTPLFINHTLWSRDDDLILFYARGDFYNRDRSKRVNLLFTVKPDGSDLTLHDNADARQIGGHPEWAQGHAIAGGTREHQILYDVDRKKIVETFGDRTVFPVPDGDKAFSPDGTWFVNGYPSRGKNYYVLFRRSDKKTLRTAGFDQNGYRGGPTRLDAAPCFNRDGTKLLIPAIASDKQRTRQMFILDLPLPAGKPKRESD